MKVRMIIGEHEEHDSSMPVPQAFLACISFPMDMTYYGDDPDHPETVTIDNEEELDIWATQAFESHEIWSMEIPAGAFVQPDQRVEHVEDAADAITIAIERLAPYSDTTDHRQALYAVLHKMITEATETPQE